ncbi:MAG: hypothetical protein Q8L14_08300 [Myxococcales bacterium]|nr:hypothetical protein [Myxococcales bacterium]
MRFIALMSLVVLAACGPVKPTSDGGSVDDSCGIDCVAQTRFGIIANRCFEYSVSDSMKNDPPKLGALVKPVFTLEGGVKVMPVEYREGGQTLMIDNFSFENGNLKLLRREFPRQGRSVTFRNDAMAITGVTWLLSDAAPGQNQTTNVQADSVDQSGMHTIEAASYRVTTQSPTPVQLKTPLSDYSSGLRMLTSQMPDRGADPIRTFVPDLGFITITSPFNYAGGNPTPVFLQRVRDIGSADAGSEPCSLGIP